MLVGRPHHVSNVSPNYIQGCELHEGEMGQVGAIVVWKYVHDGEAKVLKERIEPVDLENNQATYRKSFVITFQVTPKEGEPGSIAHWHFEYENINDEVAHPETLLQFAVEVSKEIDEHLFKILEYGLFIILKSELIFIYLFLYFETKVSSLIDKGRDLLRIIRNYLTKQPAAKVERMAEAATTEVSSLVGKLETEVEIKASAGKFHHMFAGRPHHVSKASPGNIQGCDLHEGDWGKVGSIVYWNYVHDGEAKVAKERIEAVEPEKNLITFRVIEGDLMKEYKSFLLTIQVTPKHGGPGSIVHWHLEYEKISEEVAHPETLLQFCVEVSKEIDEHLLSEE
ncbi:hypothetical protein N665_1352s0009 [Sinapis alba]|nr:hypothetical protein N665_1352s0009 [Sinapis alba]